MATHPFQKRAKTNELEKGASVSANVGSDSVCSRGGEAFKNRQMQLLRTFGAKREMRIEELANELGAKHQIDNVAAFGRLIGELELLPEMHPTLLTIQPGKVEIEKGVGEFKKAKGDLKSFSGHLNSALAIYYKLYDDPVWPQALVGAYRHMRADPETGEPTVEASTKLVGLLEALDELADIARLAASIKNTAGNRTNPDWHAAAAEKCRSFWQEYMGEEPAHYFSDSSTALSTNPGANKETMALNPFSEWFCDTMSRLHGLTPSICKTALKKETPKCRPYWENDAEANR